MTQLSFDPSEKVLLKVRGHWLVFLGPITQTLIAAVAPFVLFVIIATLGAVPSFIYEMHVLSYLAVWWLLISWCAIVIVWTDYYLDLWILTNKRIINIRQTGLFDRTTATWDLHRIQEITVHKENFIQTIFNYGELQIQTAGPSDEYARVRGIPDPDRVRAMILTEME